MQPYFFPYIGYFQLIAESDVFVFYDDVQFVKGGWVNRNRILQNGAPAWFTFPVRAGALSLPINRRRYQRDPAVVARLLRRLDAAYRKAPCFEAIFRLVETLLQFGDADVAAFNADAIVEVAARLGIAARFVRSSELEKDETLAGEARVIDICRRLGATRYVNPIGGAHLYSARRFAEAGIELRFLHSAAPAYRQFDAPAVRDLSIIDVLAFNDPPAAAQLLRACRIAPAGELCG